MKASRRSILKALLAIPAIYSTKRFDPDPDDPEFTPGIVDGDVVIKIPGSLCADPTFDLPAFLAGEVSRIETRQPLRFCARLNEFYAESGEVGFLFRCEGAGYGPTRITQVVS